MEKTLSTIQTFLQTCSAMQMRLYHLSPKLPCFSALYQSYALTSLCQCDCFPLKHPRKLQRKTVREKRSLLYFPFYQLFNLVTLILFYFV